jgi:hypothetical protein
VTRHPLVVFAVVGLSASCGSPSTDETAAGRPPKVLTEHRVAELGTYAAERARLRIGADCSAHGAPSCASGLCLHTSRDRDHGFVCTQRCVDPRDCPSGWRCVQTHPSEQATLCIPEAEGASGVAP